MKLHEILKEQFLTDHAKIKTWLDVYKIRNYTINSDFTVDVNGIVNLYGESLISIPVQFGVVTEYFNCSFNYITSLAGCPSSVGKHFYCDGNNIASLEGIADQLKSINGGFICDDDKIESHVLGLMLVDGITEIYCKDKWAEILNECIKNKLGIYDAQTKLHEANLEEYAQL